MGVNVQSFNETLETLKPQIDIMNGRQKSALANLPVFHLKGTCLYAPYFYLTFFKNFLNHLMIIMIIPTIISWKPLLGALFRQAKTSRPREREADYAISEMLISDSSSS